MGPGGRLPARIAKSIQAIALDRTRGAAELARQAAQILRELNGAEAEQAALALVGAQPAMAPLANLANRVLLSPGGTRRVCEAFLKELAQAARRTALRTAKLIRARATVVTHSFSRTVFDALVFSRPKRISILATESRPLAEGVRLAAELQKARIPVTLIPDSMLAAAVMRASLVLVGADAVTPAGLVNKVGTSLAALAAKAYKKPFYAACDGAKFWPGRLSADNQLFDTTPLGWITGVVCEQGLLGRAAVRARLRDVRLHPALR